MRYSLQHDQHLIHRDIKPENMLVRTKNEVLLSDFGLSVVNRSTLTLNMEDKVIVKVLLFRWHPSSFAT